MIISPDENTPWNRGKVGGGNLLAAEITRGTQSGGGSPDLEERSSSVMVVLLMIRRRVVGSSRS